MKPGLPWSVKGIEPDVREAAKLAARRSGMTLGEWLNSTILEQADGTPAAEAPVPRLECPHTQRRRRSRH
jgi:localization factor PodJL